MFWLLDTNIIVAASKSHPAVLSHLKKHSAGDLLLPSIVRAEIEFGIAKSVRRAHNRQVFDSIMHQLNIVPFGLEAACCYGQLRSDLERKGTPIGSNDTLIAAETLALGATLVTDNMREFSRVPGLLLENWLRD